jgi:hypothetical protein
MLNYRPLRGVRDPSRHTVQRGARSKWVRPTGCLRAAINQQNPLKPGVRELPIPNRPGQQVRHGEGNRTDGRSPVRISPSPTRKWVGQSQDLWSADARLMGVCQGFRECPRSASGKACKARKPESTRGRVGSYSGRGVTVELRNPHALPPPRGADGRGDRRTRECGGRARVVVRGRESRLHGEGRQQVRSCGAGIPGARS